MNAPARHVADAAHRARVLRALGLAAWQRRVPGTPAGPAADAATGAGDPAAGRLAPCVVVLAPGVSARALDLVGRALTAGGPVLARAGRVVLHAGAAPALPAAQAYLVFGEVSVDALGRAAAPGQLRHARIVVADEPDVILTQAPAKRRLWQALGEVRRALAGNAGRA